MCFPVFHRIGLGKLPNWKEEVMIAPEKLEDFRKLYEEEYGRPISKEDAQLKAQEIIELFRILCRPPI